MTRSTSSPRRTSKAIAILAIALVVACAVPAAGQQAEPPSPSGPNTGAQLKAEYDEVLGAEAALQAEIDKQAAKQQEIAGQIKVVEQQLGVVGLRLESANRLWLRAVAAERVALQALAAAKVRMQKAVDAMHAEAVSAYMYGGVSPPSINVLLHSFDGTTEAGQTSSYANAILDHQRTVVSEYKAARTARNRANALAKRARTSATAIRDTIQAEQVTLKKKRVEVELLRQDSDKALFIQTASLVQLRSKKIEIETRIVSLEKASDGIAMVLAARQKDQPDYTAGDIDFAPPIPGATPGSPFGMRFHPILHYERLHPGIDFGMPPGTPIHAAANGIVVIAGERGGYGNATVIDNGFSIATVYAHQSRIDVKVGQIVQQGDVIGAVGSTGLSTGPHLHFETRVRGVPVNPTNFIDFAAPADPSGTESGD